MPELSIIIVNWNTASFLRGCIQSILENSDGIDYEIIVVDNASTDGSPEMVQAEFGHLDNLILICNERNENYARGNNIGYEHSSGKYICLLNSDIVVQPGMFRALMDHLAGNPKVGLVGPQVLNPEGSSQLINRRFPQWHFLFLAFSYFGRIIDYILFNYQYRRLYFYADEDFSQPTPIDQLGTSCAMLRRSLLEDIGELCDEQFSLYFNDVDLCKRIHAAGYQIQLIPATQVIHYLSKSIGLLSNNDRSRLEMIGMVRFVRKHQMNGAWILFLLWPRFAKYTAIEAVQRWQASQPHQF